RRPAGAEGCSIQIRRTHAFRDQVGSPAPVTPGRSEYRRNEQHARPGGQVNDPRAAGQVVRHLLTHEGGQPEVRVERPLGALLMPGRHAMTQRGNGERGRHTDLMQLADQFLGEAGDAGYRRGRVGEGLLVALERPPGQQTGGRFQDGQAGSRATGCLSRRQDAAGVAQQGLFMSFRRAHATALTWLVDPGEWLTVVRHTSRTYSETEFLLADACSFGRYLRMVATSWTRRSPMAARWD